MCSSEWHRPDAAIFTRTSVGWGSSTSSSTLSNLPCGARRMDARVFISTAFPTPRPPCVARPPAIRDIPLCDQADDYDTISRNDRCFSGRPVRESDLSEREPRRGALCADQWVSELAAARMRDIISCNRADLRCARVSAARSVTRLTRRKRVMRRLRESLQPHRAGADGGAAIHGRNGPEGTR